MRVGRCVVTALLVGAVLGAACATNPVTGERELTLVSESQEIAMGREGAEAVEASIGLVDDASLQNYVRDVGLALARDSERPDLPWSFGVVNDPTPNAFALPGGFIYVTRGMMTLMNSEAELASVLGHEIGHVTARHSVRMITRQQLAQVGLGLGSIFVPEVRPFGDAIGAGLGLLFLQYGRDAERQADDLGFEYIRAQGYDTREMADVFRALGRLGTLEGSSRSSLPDWLSTHPAPDDRVEAVEARLAARGGPTGSRVNAAEYLGHLESMVYGDDPREGYFREDEFIHPTLRFRFTIPASWTRQNLPRAVQALSPGEDGAIQLTLANVSTPGEAARVFAAQSNVAVTASGSDRINGLDAIVARFEVAASGQTVAGVAAWIGYDGRVYELLGYAPVRAIASHESTFRQVIASFRALTDRALIDVEPHRVRIRRIDTAMSLEAFNGRFPSTVPLPELAVLNGVERAESRLAAGTQAKQID